MYLCKKYIFEMRKVFNTAYFFVAIIIGVLAGSCASGAGGFAVEGGDTITRRSELLTMVDCGDYVVAEIKNPWGDGLLARYLLVSDDYEGDLPEVDELTSVVITPVRRSVVFSSVYGGAIAELGAADAISGVTDGQYFVLPEIAEAIAAGRIADVGNSMSPSVESIVDCNPSALITSPYQGQEQGAIERLGIPVIAMVDYMEPTPLGRAEWLRLIGELYGRRHKADSIYQAVEADYERLRAMTAGVESRPVVITEQPQPGGQWDVPSGQSYMAQMLADAGADYPWASTEGAGSLKLDIASVYDRAHDADYWLIRSYGPLTASSLSSISPLTARFKALTSGGLYVCDTSQSPLFDEFPFHPERLLTDYIKIFHPDLLTPASLRYFSQEF